MQYRSVFFLWPASSFDLPWWRKYDLPHRSSSNLAWGFPRFHVIKSRREFWNIMIVKLSLSHNITRKYSWTWLFPFWKLQVCAWFAVFDPHPYGQWNGSIFWCSCLPSTDQTRWWFGVHNVGGNCLGTWAQVSFSPHQAQTLEKTIGKCLSCFFQFFFIASSFATKMPLGHTCSEDVYLMII